MISATVTERMREKLYLHEPVFSFEFFPPKDEKGAQVLEESLKELALLNPTFVSVTCGAAGNTRILTRDLVCQMQEKYPFSVMAHVTAVGFSAAELTELIQDYHRHGIRNFLALRGDPPRDQPEWIAPKNQLPDAASVVELIRKLAPDASVGVAGYPEKHPKAETMLADLRSLKIKVDAGADFVVTQLFFNADDYFDYTRQARDIGVKIPILPGIIPITRPGQIERFTELGGSKVPERLYNAICATTRNKENIQELGICYATGQAVDLLRRGAPGIHLFTLNKSRASHLIYSALNALGW